MHHLRLINIITVLFLLSGLVTLSAQNSEFRATWVITWNYINATSSIDENKQRIIQILENHKKANMNAVLWQVRQAGTAYYPSSYEPWGSYAGGAYPGFDPLAFVIEEAHKRGLEVHAWFNTFHVSSTAQGTIYTNHPDWICTDQSGKVMTKNFCVSPGIREARNYTVDVAMEIVNKYDIDGLHLDYVRWNEYDATDMKSAVSTLLPDGMVSEDRLARLKSAKEDPTRFLYDQYHPYSGGIPAGYATWADWRRAMVTEFVRALHDSIQSVKPHVRLSVAALGKYKTGGDTGWNGYYVVFQDAALWFNAGYIEQLTPMHYHWLTGADMLGAISTDWEPEIQPGIAAKRLYTAGPGSYMLENNNCWDNHRGIVSALRTKTWIDGFQFFSYASWRDRNYWQEAGETFFSRLTHVREINPGTPPPAPDIALEKIDSLHYIVTVSPVSTDDCWYAVYRSEDQTFDPDHDEIVEITFGKSPFAVNEMFDGLQMFNGRYYYFATGFNRFWNESLSADYVVTDPIPSLPPVVTGTEPAQNGTIDIGDQISFTFSKEMDTLSITSGYIVSPDASVTFRWTADRKSVKIGFPGNLMPGTGYTFTLTSGLTDANGKAIDGNGDGMPGDEYRLNFNTREQDKTGPVIIHSTLKANDRDIDVASVFSFTFSEVIATATVFPARIVLLDSTNNSVAVKYALYVTDDRKSVLCIQPVNMLSPYCDYTLRIDGDITDLAGNAAGDDMVFAFTTSRMAYSEVKQIDEFDTMTGWQTPSYSGSTKGIISSETSFTRSLSYAVPASTVKSSASLKYMWDQYAPEWLIREYVDAASAPAQVIIDTTYILQVYIFGDSSNTRFRFCIDEGNGTQWDDHEVSQWHTINWRGWKLVEWKLSDPGSIGSWISPNNRLQAQFYRTDSFQFTREAGSSVSGTIWLDSYRAVKKVHFLSLLDAKAKLISAWPNPFGISATVQVKIPASAHYRISVYDALGQVVEVLHNGNLSPDIYTFSLGDGYASGLYVVELRSKSIRQTIKIIKGRL